MMSMVFSSEPLWGYTIAHVHRYRPGSVTVVLFPPDAPQITRRLLLVQRFSGATFAIVWGATAVAGATLILVEVAIVLALAFAAATSNALHRSTRPARQQVVRVHIPGYDTVGHRRELLDDFLEAAHRRPRTPDDLRPLHELWCQLYADLKSLS